MADLTDFLRWVEVGCEAAPRNLVLQAILSSGEKFCRYSGIWNDAGTSIQLVDATASYDITLPAAAVLCRIEAVHYRGTPLSPSDAAWGAQASGGYAPYVFWLDPPDQLVLSPTPSGTFTADDLITYRAVFAPTKDATTLPDVLLDDYEQAIVAGALAHIYAIPGKVWTDRTEAREQEKKFYQGAAAAKIRVATGNTNSVLPPAHGYFA